MKLKNLLTAFLAVFLLMSVFPQVTKAGIAQIEEGTVFTENATKDGMSIKVTKTYTREKVIIRQIIYDASGKLLRDKTTEKPVPANVQIIVKGQTVTRPPLPTKSQAKPTPTAKIPTPTTQLQVNAELELAETDISPDNKIQKAILLAKLKQLQKSYIGADNPNRIYIEGAREGKLLGIVTISIPVKIVYDTTADKIISEDKSTVSKVLDALSTN